MSVEPSCTKIFCTRVPVRAAYTHGEVTYYIRPPRAKAEIDNNPVLGNSEHMAHIIAPGGQNATECATCWSRPRNRESEGSARLLPLPMQAP